MGNIRKFKTDDKQNLLQILRNNTPEYFSPEEENDFSSYLDHEIEDYFVIETDEKVVGCGGINYFHDTKSVRISWDIIDVLQQGKGIGKQLLVFRIQHIKREYPEYTIKVRTAQNVYLFYEKNGFQLLKIEKDYWALGYDLYEMEYIG